MEKYMTTREVAEALGVSRDTVKNCIRRIMPDKMQNGKTTFLNEQEVACISKELKGNIKVTEQLTCEAASQVKNSTTELEIITNAAVALTQLQGLLAQKTKEVEALKIELDESKEWYSVKRMMIEDGREFSWRPLKKYSDEHGYDIKKVFDANYGEVNAYHIDVWHAVYGVEV